MKIFKRVYFSAMTVLAVLAIVFSFVLGTNGSFKSVHSNGFYDNVESHLNEIAKNRRNEFEVGHYNDSRDYIVNELASFGGGVAIRVDGNIDEEDNKTDATVAKQNNKPFATLVVQDAIVLDETQALIPFENVVVSAAKTVNNIIVYLPGTVTQDASGDEAMGKAVLFTAHYDSVSLGATDNAAAVAAMIESIRYIKDNNIAHKNDLVFVFTDAKEQGALGAFTFINQFKGFDNVVERVGLGIDFSSMGASDKLMLVDSSTNDGALLKALGKTKNGAYSLNSVVNYFNNDGTRISDFDAFSAFPALGFANVNKTQNAKTTLDKINDDAYTLSKNIANMIVEFSGEFGNLDLLSLNEGAGAVYFNYLGINISYSNVISYILAGLVAILAAAVIILAIRKNSFSFIKMAMGMMIQLLTVAATAVVLFAFYFVITLLLAGFGVIPVNIITKVIYSNPAIILLLCVLSGAIMSGLYIVLKKAFNANAGDIVRGNALIWVLLGLIFGFAVPKIGFIFVVGALLQLISTLVFILLKDKFNARAVKEGSNSKLAGIGGLFLYSWAAILTIPVVFTVLTIATGYTLAILLPILSILLMGLLATFVPYADYIKPLFDNVFAKLPKRKITRKVKVIEEQEHKAKKGLKQKVEVVKKETYVIDRKYTHALGILVASVICVISLVFASAFGASFGTNYTAWKTLDNVAYDSAIVYEWEKRSDGEVTTNLAILDPMAYKLATNYISGYKWNSKRGVYLKEYNNTIVSSTLAPSVTKSGDVISVKMFAKTEGRVILTLKGLSNSTLLTFTSETGETFEYNNTKAKDEIEFKIPRGFGDFTITLEGSSSQLNVKYEESVLGNSSSDGIEDVLLVREGLDSKGQDGEAFKSGIVLRLEADI